MQTRRVFIKILLGLGAILLPGSFLATRLREAIETGLVHPPVKLLLPPPSPGNYKIDAESLNRTAMDDILTLSTPEMQGRKAGTVGEAKAAEYLASQLSRLGLEPMGGPEPGFTQAFTVPTLKATKVNGRVTFKPEVNQGLRTPCVNLLGGLRGENLEEIVLLSAHYDHLGSFEGRVYPGANDNASGVGCVLDVLRRILREGNVPKRTIVIAFWSAEEMGFVGSQAFVHSAPFSLKKIQAVLNADTVGNGTIGNFALWADGENSAVKAIRQAAVKCGATALLTPTNGHNSDSVSFASVNIPAVTLMARDWLYKNHTPEDDITLLKPEQINKATEIMYEAVRMLAF